MKYCRLLAVLINFQPSLYVTIIHPQTVKVPFVKVDAIIDCEPCIWNSEMPTRISIYLGVLRAVWITETEMVEFRRCVDGI